MTPIIGASSFCPRSDRTSRPDRPRRLRHHPGHRGGEVGHEGGVGLAVAAVHDVQLAHVGLVDPRHRRLHERAQLLQEVDLAALGAGRLPLRGHHAQRLGGGLAVLDEGRRLAARPRGRGQPRRLRRQHHVALQAQLLELAAQPLQLLLGDGARRLGGDRGLVLDGLGLPLQPRQLAAQHVALLEHQRLRLLLGRLRPLAGGRLLLGDLLVGLVLRVLGVADHDRDARAPEVLQVLLLVGHVLHLQHVQLQAELVEVVLRVVLQGLGELEAVLVHLLGGELGQHLAQHALPASAGRPPRSARGTCSGSARPRCARGRGRWRS